MKQVQKESQNIDRKIILQLEYVKYVFRAMCIRFIAKFISSWKNADPAGKDERERSSSARWILWRGGKEGRRVGERRQERNEKNWGIKLHLLASRRHLPRCLRTVTGCIASSSSSYVAAATVCSFKGPVRRALIKFAREKILPDWVSIRKDDECPQHRVGWLAILVARWLIVHSRRVYHSPGTCVQVPLPFSH